MKNLTWIQEDEKWRLKNDEAILVDVTINLASTSTFSIEHKQYQVVKKGFFSPVYIVQSNEGDILNLSHSFWGSKGRIVFNDGAIYSCDYKYKGGFKMHFMDGDNNILSYARAIENKKTVPAFSIGISMVDAEKLLILSALGLILLQSLFMEDSSDNDVALLTSIAAIS